MICYGQIRISRFPVGGITKGEFNHRVAATQGGHDLIYSSFFSLFSVFKNHKHSLRGVSYTFGHDVIERFLKKHDLNLICRAHQVVEDGYEFQCNRQLVTIFSAPNYCGEFDNAGAVMVVNEDLVCSFKIIRPASHVRKIKAREAHSKEENL